MNQKLFLVFFVCFWGVFPSQAQEFRLIDFQEQNDKLGQYVKSVGQDSTGFIWLGTDDGLLRYDGIHFDKFTKGLPSKYIKHLFLTQNGRFLASTDVGIAEIQTIGDSVHIRTLIHGSRHATDSTVWMSKQLYEDRYQNLWISDNERLHCYKKGKLHSYNFGLENHSHDYKRSFSVAEDGYDNVYAYSFTGNLFRYNSKYDNFSPIELPTKLHLVSAMIQVQTGVFLIASRSGLYEMVITPQGTVIGLGKVSPETGIVCLTRAEKNKIYAGTHNGYLIEIQYDKGQYQLQELGQYSNNSINHIIRTKVGNYWLATDDGVIFLKHTYFRPLFGEETKSYIHFIGKSPDGKIYFADSKHFYQVHETNQKFELQKLYSEDNFTIQSASIDLENIWICNDNGEITQINRQTKVVKKIKVAEDGQRITAMNSDAQNRLWVCMFGHQGIVKVTPDFDIQHYSKADGLQNTILAVRVNPDNQVLFSGSGNSTYLYTYDELADKFINVSAPVNYSHFEVQDFDFDSQGNVWLGTNHGLFRFRPDTAPQKIYLEGSPNEAIKALSIDQEDNIWLANAHGLLKYRSDNTVVFTAFNGLPTKNVTYRDILVDTQNRLWIGTAKGLAFSNNTDELKQTPTPMFRQVSINGNTQKSNNHGVIMTEGGYIELDFLALSFPGKGVNYRYRIIQKEKSSPWSEEIKEHKMILPSLEIGKYTFEIQAKQQGNYTWSESNFLPFTIRPIWYRKWQSYVLIIIIIGLLLLIAVRVNTWRLEREKRYLEDMVLERTNDIQEKNMQLEQRREEVMQQADNLRSAYTQISLQHEVITKKNKNINAAINYAARIQSAILPIEPKMHTHFEDLMVLFQPRDTVSGDFYWYSEKKNLIFMAAADCTGHGIPGAFMSLIGNDLLNEIINDLKIYRPKRILNELHERIRIVLRQRETGNQDGMDIALVSIDTVQQKLYFAGANNPLVYIQLDEDRKPKMHVIKGDKLPIGGKRMGKQRIFKQHTLDIGQPTTFYLYSDGYQDQFGGNKGQKFMSRRFREMLFDIHDRPMPMQKTLLQKMFTQWRGKNRQIDDLLVIGAKWNPKNTHSVD